MAWILALDPRFRGDDDVKTLKTSANQGIRLARRYGLDHESESEAVGASATEGPAAPPYSQ